MDSSPASVPWSTPDIGREEAEAVQKVMQSGWISMGPMVKAFERELSRFIGARDAVMVNNGTSALLAVYLATGIRPGDKVLVPSYTFIATVNALVVIGAKPVLMDADKETFNVSPAIVEESLKKNRDARFVIVVDVAGMPCDLDAISKICQKNNATLIEDAAEAIGAEYRGRRVGSSEHVSVFSFHAAKLVSSIEGGAIVINNSELAEKVRLIRSHGEDPTRKYWHVAVGLNLRPLEFQGALALAQLPKIDRYIRNRNKIVQLYNEELVKFVEPQHVPTYVTRHPYMIHLSLLANNKQRDALAAFLSDHKVDYRLPWPPAHLQGVGHGLGYRCPIATNLSERVMSLPLFNNMRVTDANHVVEVVKSFFAKRR